VARIRVKVIVRGIVQGVQFRAILCEVARRYQVDGWVRNRADGAVEAILEGDQLDVKDVIAWAHRGPGRARVDSVTVSRPEKPVGLKGFRITG
jgi:acylphosphatase